MTNSSQDPQPQPEGKLMIEERAFPRDEPWLVQVDVYIEDDTTTPPKFYIKSCLPEEKRTIGGQQEDYLIFNNNCRPGFKILFKLHDIRNNVPEGEEYRFPQRAEDAVWSKIGDECPHKETATNEVFKPEKIFEPARDTLRVKFDNDRKIGDFRYTLNVTKDGGRTYLELDPGGTGNNGQTKIN